jgi:hypothetical protein
MVCLQAANNGHLQQLAVFGTSMRSLADTQALVAALAADPAAAAGSTAGAFEAIGKVQQQQQQAASIATSSEQSSSAGAGAAGADVLQLAYQRGCVLEVPSPDCAAHAVGVAVHLFLKGSI